MVSLRSLVAVVVLAINQGKWHATTYLCNEPLSLLTFILVLAQSAPYTDQGIQFNGITESGHGVTYGFVLPPTTATGATAQEFIGEIVSPIANKWVS
jgi:hypothetical protein